MQYLNLEGILLSLPKDTVIKNAPTYKNGTILLTKPTHYCHIKISLLCKPAKSIFLSKSYQQRGFFALLLKHPRKH